MRTLCNIRCTSIQFDARENRRESVWLISVSLFPSCLRFESQFCDCRRGSGMCVSLSRATRINLSFSSTCTKKRVHDLHDCVRSQSADVPLKTFRRLSFTARYIFFSFSLSLSSLRSPWSPCNSLSYLISPHHSIHRSLSLPLTLSVSFLLRDVWCFAFVPVIRRKKRIIDRKCWDQMLNSSSARCSVGLLGIKIEDYVPFLR